MVKTSLRQVSSQVHQSPEYLIDVDLSQVVVRPAHVTIGVRRCLLTDPGVVLGRSHTADVAGFRVASGNIYHVEQMVRRLLAAMINYGRLPDYVFIARRSERIYPVYTMGDEVIVTTPGGPVFRDVELAKVREHLAEYMYTTGELGEAGKSDKLHVRGVSRSTLTLLRPIFYLKKRLPGQAEFWAPVFEAEDGQSVYAYVASAKREVPIQDGLEVLILHNMCADALIADGRLEHTYDLRIDRLMPEYWARVRARLHPEPCELTFTGKRASSSNQPIPIFRYDGVTIGVEPRSDEARWGLFVGDGAEEVRYRMALDFFRRGLIEDTGCVKLVSLAKVMS
jgi:hypothetical protein